MNYTVTWTPGAQQELAAVWLAAADRNAVTAASHRLDQDLADDPFAVGLPRNSSVNRTAVEPPLGIDYEIIEGDKKVRVLRVWAISAAGRGCVSLSQRAATARERGTVPAPGGSRLVENLTNIHSHMLNP